MSNPYEIFGTIFGLLSVWLTIKKNIWLWPTGIINIVLFFVMFYEAKLYAELITYSVFFVLSVYGWWEWLHGGENRTELPMAKTPRRTVMWLVAIGVVWWPLQSYLFHTYTDAALPYWDSAITVLSLLAQWMLAKKYLENWWLWITVDVMAIGVYWVKDLHVTSGLYLVFLVLATMGLIQWKKDMRKAAPEEEMKGAA